MDLFLRFAQTHTCRHAYVQWVMRNNQIHDEDDETNWKYFRELLACYLFFFSIRRIARVKREDGEWDDGKRRKNRILHRHTHKRSRTHENAELTNVRRATAMVAAAVPVMRIWTKNKKIKMMANLCCVARETQWERQRERGREMRCKKERNEMCLWRPAHVWF